MNSNPLQGFRVRLVGGGQAGRAVTALTSEVSANLLLRLLAALLVALLAAHQKVTTRYSMLLLLLLCSQAIGSGRCLIAARRFKR